MSDRKWPAIDRTLFVLVASAGGWYLILRIAAELVR